MRADPAVLKELRASNRGEVLLAQPVIAEIAYGIARLPKSKRRTLLEERFGAIATAAHAVATAATLVTANVKQLSAVPGLVLEDWER